MKRRVLVTCGPTWVAIDSARVISNQSTGEMGHLIAEGLLKKNIAVTLLEGPVTHQWSNKKARVLHYKFFDELAKLLEQQLQNKYEAVVHAAAVSDFKPKQESRGKINSGQSLVLNLVPTPKLISRIKAKAPQAYLVGFKLGTEAEAQKLFGDARCDCVVVNTTIGGYRGVLIDAQKNILVRATGKRGMARAVVNTVCQKIANTSS